MKRMIVLAGIVILALSVAGCATGRVESDYGTSHNLQKYNQTLNPAAERNLKPVEGMDGKAAQAAVEKYQKGGEKSQPANQFNFNIGTTGK